MTYFYNQQCSPTSRQRFEMKRKSIRKEVHYDESTKSKFGEILNTKPCFKENQSFFRSQPITSTDGVDEKYYKNIDFDIPYEPQMELIEVQERKHPSMNTISCHTVSLDIHRLLIKLRFLTSRLASEIFIKFLLPCFLFHFPLFIKRY